MTPALFVLGVFLGAYVVGCVALVLHDAERDLAAAERDGGAMASQRQRGQS